MIHDFAELHFHLFRMAEGIVTALTDWFQNSWINSIRWLHQVLKYKTQGKHSAFRWNYRLAQWTLKLKVTPSICFKQIFFENYCMIVLTIQHLWEHGCFCRMPWKRSVLKALWFEVKLPLILYENIGNKGTKIITIIFFKKNVMCNK